MYTTVHTTVYCTAQCSALLSLKARPAAACALYTRCRLLLLAGRAGRGLGLGESGGAGGRPGQCVPCGAGGSRYSAASTVSPAVDQCGPASATADSDHSAAPLHPVHDIPGLGVRGPALLLLPQPARHDAGRPQPQSGCSPARTLLSQRSQPYSGQNSKCTVLSQPLITAAVQFAGDSSRQAGCAPAARQYSATQPSRPSTPRWRGTVRAAHHSRLGWQSEAECQPLPAKSAHLSKYKVTQKLSTTPRW